MQYKLVRNDIEPSFPNKPFGWVPDDMLDKVETRKVFRSGSLRDVVFWRTDVVFEHASGPMLVRNGDAEPVDDECKAACAMTPEQIAEAQRNRERLAKGINPEDWDAYGRGYMAGYDPDGKWIPGSNYAEWLKLQEVDEDEESEE